jgi:hypothetical protein
VYLANEVMSDMLQLVGERCGEIEEDIKESGDRLPFPT